ncbi:hypothetical protein KFU94_13445 [Chloroflexi bacterium TSY]|nr:hypothetical protein [Chloroflexi bacterium TSY]
MARMTNNQNDARVWLRANGYENIAIMIDEIMNEWERKGVRTRRNWWDILAGGKNGKPKTVAGKTFLVLKTAQIRAGKEPTANSICNKEQEVAPSIRITNRWVRNE